MDESIRMESETIDSSEEQDLHMELGNESSPHEQVRWFKFNVTEYWCVSAGLTIECDRMLHKLVASA